MPGFDEKVLALYARGMTTREIQGHLEEVYGVEVSPTLISTVTDAVLDEVRAWQARPLEAAYPIVFLDAKERRTVAKDLRAIDQAPTVDAAEQALNAQLRKVTKKRRAFPTPDAVKKVMYLALQRASRRWTRPIHDWPTALNHPALVFPGRVPV